MRTKEIKVKYNDAYLLPISDTHIGDKGFTKKTEKKLISNLDWVKKTKNAYICLNGDILNTATLTSPSSPFEQKEQLEEQIEHAIRLFKPVKHKIVGAIDGGHENRISKHAGYSPTIALCRELDIDYMQNSALYLFRMGMKKGHCARETFAVYCHHSTGGGRSMGSKINRVAMLRDIIADADVYCAGHSHMVGAIPAVTQVINRKSGTVKTIRQMIVNSGSYLEWNESYAERMMLPPTRLGSPRIHFFIKQNYSKKGRSNNGLIGVRKDIHVSI